MQFLDSLTINSPHGPRYIELYHGDLANLPPEHAVDLLVVSAYPDNYHPVPGTLVKALYDHGLSMTELADTKAVDLRQHFGCWLSTPITGRTFGRVLCFEPRYRGEPPEVVGDIFQSLIPVLGEGGVTSIAMPVVAAGRQGIPLAEMFEPLLEAAAHWLALGLSVQTIKIVEVVESRAYELKGAFAILKKRYKDFNLIMSPPYRYDLFISYSSLNRDAILYFADELARRVPKLRIFLDRAELQAGATWQQAIFEALDDCNKVVPFYSPQYLASKVCKEEFNIALFRHRETGNTLLPILLHSTDLPTYMKLIQFIDCREADRAKLGAACMAIIDALKA